ncbi:hypothetical protein [Pantanalinema sp. GBBB05]|uniref:hypothetical protein n=1 Tax=Pantanalinema sp. GBBB05 TaxID=2604139 RepID=UPI003D81C0FD
MQRGAGVLGRSGHPVFPLPPCRNTTAITSKILIRVSLAQGRSAFPELQLNLPRPQKSGFDCLCAPLPSLAVMKLNPTRDEIIDAPELD